MQLGSQVPVGGDLSSIRGGRVHVVGLGGTGVRGLVPLLLDRGVRVSGSDKDDSPVIAKFRRDGVECSVGHSDRNVLPGTDLVLISAAVTPDNPEVRVAKQRSIAVLKYAQCLGFLMGEKEGIAISGTHGKTTTSAMVCSVLVHAGRDPSFVIGGDHSDLGGGSRSGNGSHFVAEACEFDRSFLNLRPRATVVTNIEEDHLDYFESLSDIQGAFRQFVGLLPEDGFLVYSADDPNSCRLPESSRARSNSFSLEPGKGDWWAEDVEFRGEGSTFDVIGPGGLRVPFELVVPGDHNVRNALACPAVCSWAGIPLEEIAAGLRRFRGVRRRFDVLARKPCTVVDDYAHHPTEVETVLRAARQTYPDRQLVCVFQPHQYSRLRRMLEGFADALSLADDVIITQVYRARDSEADVRSVQASVLNKAVGSRGVSSSYAEDFPRAIELLEAVARTDSVVIFLGAGDVTDLAGEFASALSGGRVRLEREPRAPSTSVVPAIVHATPGLC